MKAAERMVFCVPLRTVCGVVHVPLLSFVVEHSHRDDQDESDASDHRPGYDPGQVVWEMTEMFQETRGLFQKHLFTCFMAAGAT